MDLTFSETDNLFECKKSSELEADKNYSANNFQLIITSSINVYYTFGRSYFSAVFYRSKHIVVSGFQVT